MDESQPLPAITAAAASGLTAPRAIAAAVERRMLKLKPKIESGTSQFSFKRSIPGGVKLSLIGSTCTASPPPPP